MKVEVYLVKDEYSTIANFNTFGKAEEFARNKRDLNIERIEVEAPRWRHVKTVFVDKEVKDTSLVTPKTEKLDDVIDTHILNIYNSTSQNKSQTARILGLSYKTVLKRLNNIGVS